MPSEQKDFDFHALWRANIERYGHTSPAPSASQKPCDLADQFDQKLDTLIFTHLGASPSLPQLAQAKFLLQEEWQAWRRSVPQNHRDEAAGPHRCVDEAYQDAYDRLHTLHLRLHPTVNLIASYDELRQTVVDPPRKQAKPRQGRVLFGESE